MLVRGISRSKREIAALIEHLLQKRFFAVRLLPLMPTLVLMSTLTLMAALMTALMATVSPTATVTSSLISMSLAISMPLAISMLAVTGLYCRRSILYGWNWGLWKKPNGLLLLAALDDLVEFTSVEPNATALWAIVNFDVLALSHYQGGIFADRTLHDFVSLCGQAIEDAASTSPTQ